MGALPDARLTLMLWMVTLPIGVSFDNKPTFPIFPPDDWSWTNNGVAGAAPGEIVTCPIGALLDAKNAKTPNAFIAAGAASPIDVTVGTIYVPGNGGLASPLMTTWPIGASLDASGTRMLWTVTRPIGISLEVVPKLADKIVTCPIGLLPEANGTRMLWMVT